MGIFDFFKQGPSEEQLAAQREQDIERQRVKQQKKHEQDVLDYEQEKLLEDGHYWDTMEDIHSFSYRYKNPSFDYCRALHVIQKHSLEKIFSIDELDMTSEYFCKWFYKGHFNLSNLDNSMKFRYYIYKFLGLYNVGIASSDSSTINLQANELELFDTGCCADLYENRVIGHSVNYNGISGSLGGLNVGSYDYDRESFKKMIRTIENASVIITNKRVIITGSESSELTDDYIDKTKVIRRSSITSIDIIDDLIEIKTNGYPCIIKLEAISQGHFMKSPLEKEYFDKIIRLIFNYSNIKSQSVYIPNKYKLSEDDFNSLIYSPLSNKDLIEDQSNSDDFKNYAINYLNSKFKYYYSSKYNLNILINLSFTYLDLSHMKEGGFITTHLLIEFMHSIQESKNQHDAIFVMQPTSYANENIDKYLDDIFSKHDITSLINSSLVTMDSKGKVIHCINPLNDDLTSEETQKVEDETQEEMPDELLEQVVKGIYTKVNLNFEKTPDELTKETIEILENFEFYYSPKHNTNFIYIKSSEVFKKECQNIKNIDELPTKLVIAMTMISRMNQIESKPNNLVNLLAMEIDENQIDSLSYEIFEPVILITVDSSSGDIIYKSNLLDGF
ncbi:hypothetical protein [Pediococcus pentosaceus]|uniref:hypothetical protein n=1 Tax=Pediococcus pentosaceus TaxID=1255 RepID=UPI00359472E1